jgi:hypothetical protein
MMRTKKERAKMTRTKKEEMTIFRVMQAFNEKMPLP